VLHNLTITDVWSDYFVRTAHTRTDTIKHKKFFEHFKKEIVGEKCIRAERRGKNILIHLSNEKTILIHMKMTGHLLYGKYEKVKSLKGAGLKIENKKTWISREKNLSDPFNQFIHLIFSLSNGKHLAFSDMRKFAKVTLIETHKLPDHGDIAILGPEANDATLTWKDLKRQLGKRPHGKIKSVLMDQKVLAGIGNIYSDEILWASDIHPERKVETLSDTDIQKILSNCRKVLLAGITLGGDSMSDYRNIYGERGGFQNSHNAYRRTGKACNTRMHGKKCPGIITRKIIGGRSAHFCSTHQK
jgi:formamidopyrimidine-DNA glycosylase